MSAHSNLKSSSLDTEAEFAELTSAKRDALKEAAVARAELEAQLEILQMLKERDAAREGLLKEKEQLLNEQVKNSKIQLFISICYMHVLRNSDLCEFLQRQTHGELQTTLETLKRQQQEAERSLKQQHVGIFKSQL